MELGQTLSQIFNNGKPGWLARVPDNTCFDFAQGRINGPGGLLIRSPASGRWVRAS